VAAESSRGLWRIIPPLIGRTRIAAVSIHPFGKEKESQLCDHRLGIIATINSQRLETIGIQMFQKLPACLVALFDRLSSRHFEAVPHQILVPKDLSP
jgi:hypothetical protein